MNASESGSPKVAIVVLNWNGKDDTLECLKSLQQIDYANFFVIVVDNGSRDGSEEAITSAFPGVVFLETGLNLGYAGGNNAGVRLALQSSPDFVLLLNNDTVVHGGLISAFVAEAEGNRHAILGARIFFYDRPDQLWFAGGKWRPAELSFEHVGFGKTVAQLNAGKDRGPFDYITGCALFAPASAFAEIGLLDETFFLTYEETDWCYRARAKGYVCAVVPDACLWHKVSASFGGASSPLVTYFMVRNKLLWAEKHCSRWIRIRLHHEVFSHLMRQIFPPITKPAWGRPFLKRWLWCIDTWRRGVSKRLQQRETLAMLYGFRDFWLRRFGNCSEDVRAKVTAK